VGSQGREVGRIRRSSCELTTKSDVRTKTTRSGQNRPAEPFRTIGSQRYESLTIPLRRRYIADVLLPEAIIQLCILSEGFPDPSSQEAYDAARKRLDQLSSDSIEMDWQIRYHELRDARARMRKRLNLPKEGMTEEEKKQARLKAGEMESFFTGRVRKRMHNELG